MKAKKKETMAKKETDDEAVKEMSESLEAAARDTKDTVSSVVNAESVGTVADTLAQSPEKINAMMNSMHNASPEQMAAFTQAQMKANGMGDAANMMAQGQQAMAQAQQLQGAFQGGDMNAAGAAMAKLAGSAADTLPVNDTMKNLFQQFGSQAQSFGEHMTDDKLKELPGMVVDEESKEVSLFGLVGIKREYAAGLSMMYSLAALGVGNWIGKKTYGMTEEVLKTTGMHATHRHITALATAYTALFGVTNWVDINAMWQTEKRYQQNMQRLAKNVSPILDDIKGEKQHGYLSLMRVRKDDNEVIYNARRKIHYDLNTQRGHNFINLFQRLPIFVYNALRMNHRAGALGADAFQREKLEEITAKTGNSMDAIKMQQEKILARAKELHSKAEGFLSREKSYEQAQKELTGLAEEVGKQTSDVPEYLPSENKMNFAVPAASFVVSMFANQFNSNRTKVTQPVTALDMILYLKGQIEDDPSLERYKLPPQMNVDRKDNKNEVTLETYIAQIFQQHEQDCNPNNKIGKRLHEKLYKVSELIAKALRDGEIGTLQLIHLVGTRHIIRMDGKSIASEEVVRRQLARLAEKVKEKIHVDESRYFGDAAFSKDQLRDALNAMEGEEKAVYASFFPNSILESAGLKKKEITAIREKTKAQYEQYLLDAIMGLVSLGDDRLKQMGMTKAEIEKLSDAAQKIKEQGIDGVKEMKSKPTQPEGIERQITNATVDHVLHYGTVSDILELGIRE